MENFTLLFSAICIYWVGLATYGTVDGKENEKEAGRLG